MPWRAFIERLDAIDVIAFAAPPLIGGLLGARYAQGRTRRELAIAYLISVGLGIFVGGGIGEHLGLKVWATGGVMFTCAAVGQEFLAYVIAALREGVTDPSSTAGKWIDAVLGRRKS